MLGFNWGAMSTKAEPIQVPPPEQIRERLAAAVAEARALRKLLRLSEAVVNVEESRRLTRQPAVATEGRRDA